jgi:heme/copper-type cytochrome/quinol oxidase subunit 2
LLALHAVIAVALLAGWVSISRIFGRVWFYLTLWMSAAVLLAVLAMAWTAWILVRERQAARQAAPPGRRPIMIVAATAAALATVLSLGAAVGHQQPYHVMADGVRAVVPDVEAALEANLGSATGKQGNYIVFWQESPFPGAQGFGLLGELERLGYRVGVDNTWRVPATPQRVRDPGEIDSEIHLVSGAYVDEWRARTGQGYVEVAEHDGRTAEQRERFDELAARVDHRLTEIGRQDLIPIVDLNILGASLEPGLPEDIVDDLGEMLELGEPVVVFIAPPGAFLNGIAARIAAEAAGS